MSWNVDVVTRKTLSEQKRLWLVMQMSDEPLGSRRRDVDEEWTNQPTN
jgi:hypothetical protein